MQGFLFLKTYIEERVIDIANYIIDNNATVERLQSSLESARAQRIKMLPQDF